jgi:hypothetical protein
LRKAAATRSRTRTLRLGAVQSSTVHFPPFCRCHASVIAIRCMIVGWSASSR